MTTISLRDEMERFICDHVTSRSKAEVDDMCGHQRAFLWYNVEKRERPEGRV